MSVRVTRASHPIYAHRRNPLSSPRIFRRRNRRKRRQTGLAGCRLLRDAIQPPHETAALARAQLVPALGKAGAIRHPPRADHLCHAGRLLVHLLFCPDRALSGVAHGRLRDHLHDGARVFTRARSRSERGSGAVLSGALQGTDKGAPSRDVAVYVCSLSNPRAMIHFRDEPYHTKHSSSGS